jgi:inhibitor of cysteine peptidase
MAIQRILLGTFAVCLLIASSVQAKDLGEADDGHTVVVHVGDMLDVHLPENASTGYRWETDSFDPKLVEFVNKSADTPPGPPGTPGMAVFQFRVIAAGSSAVSLKYWRQWEGDKSIVKRFRVTIDSRSN